MLRTERPRIPFELQSHANVGSDPHEILLAVAPPPKAPSFFLSGWPNWLVPQFRSGGHRPEIRLLGEEGDE
jgi:hypothetical protein